MFGLLDSIGKEKEKKLKEKEIVIIDACSAVLGFTYGLIKSNKEKAQDNFSLGYVWGFVSCLLERNGYGPSGESLAVITMVFLNVFGMKEGQDLIVRAFHLQESRNGAMVHGMTAGGNDMKRWMNDTKDPVGWLAHVLSPDLRSHP